ncbi:MAG: hypothetical protein ACUVUB_02965 [Candidatus Bathyarchaeia archaeon]
MRTTIGLILIIIFIWATMLLGLVLIFVSLPYITSTLTVKIGKIGQNIIILGISAVMVTVWLWIWKRLAFKYFQWSLKRSGVGRPAVTQP